MVRIVREPADPRVTAVLERHPRERAALIPMLQDLQREFGFLSREAMREAGRHARIPDSVVYGVATFYAQFFFVPQGRHRVKVCQGTACHVRGAPLILDAVKRATGAGAGETTPDLKLSVERVACFGSCALAPVVVVDEKVYGSMTPARTEKLLEKLE